MSKWQTGRERNMALRTLGRFDMSLRYEDHKPVLDVRPKGFRTVLAQIRTVANGHPDDVLDIAVAVRALSRVGVK